MIFRNALAAIALFGAFAVPNVAAAQSIAYAVRDGTTNMRAGPGVDYPVVAYIRAGSAVTIFGCVADGAWCDSSVQSVRGWISTTRLDFLYAGNLVPVPRYYTYFAAPRVYFDFGYWDRYYRDRPFYGYRHHYRDYETNRPRDTGNRGRQGASSDNGGRSGDNVDNQPRRQNGNADNQNGGKRQGSKGTKNKGRAGASGDDGNGARQKGGSQGRQGGAACPEGDATCK